MKKVFFGLLLSATVLFSKAQTADEIVTKHIAAIGGEEALAKVENVVMEGLLNVGGNNVNLKITVVKDKLCRQDISMLGVNGYDLTTDKEGWTFLPFAGQTGPMQKTAEEVQAAQEDLDVTDAVCSAKAKGRQIELQGKEDINGTNCYKLKITVSPTDAITCYIDPATYYLLRVVQTKSIMGQKMTIPMDFSEFKEVAGMMMPYTMGTPQGVMTFTSIKTNQTIDTNAYIH